MIASDFCAEYAHENQNGSINFKMPIVHKFIKTYTHFEVCDFNKGMIKRLRFFMIDLYNEGIKNNCKTIDESPEKIQLSEFILNG